MDDYRGSCFQYVLSQREEDTSRDNSNNSASTVTNSWAIISDKPSKKASLHCLIYLLKRRIEHIVGGFPFMTETLFPLGIKSTVFATPKSGGRLMSALVTSLQGEQTFDHCGEIERQVFHTQPFRQQSDINSSYALQVCIQYKVRESHSTKALTFSSMSVGLDTTTQVLDRYRRRLHLQFQDNNTDQ